MSVAIIGAGVSGAFLSKLIPNSTVFERSNHAGGRSTSKRLSSGQIFDIGATVFKDKIFYLENGEQKEFDFIQFLNLNVPSLEILKHKTYPNSFYPKKGMQSIAEEFLKDKKIHFEHNLESITKSNSNLWKLKFTNGSEFEFEKIILTSPIPQIISSLKTSGIMGKWDEWIKFRGEYRSTLILTGIWENLSIEQIEKILNLEQATFLFKEEDTEYISVESFKYHIDSLVISIQFSAAFSSKNLERWIDQEKKPMQYVINSNQFFFDKILKLIGFTELVHVPASQIKVHRWRYAQADFPLFSSTGIDFSNQEFLEYLELCQKNQIWLTGDAIFGPRILQLALGSEKISKFFI
jgi:predicted NAD/FAD-dependent oxidoreductase